MSGSRPNLHVRQLFGILMGLLVAAPAAAQPCDSAPLLIANVSVWTRDGVLPGRDLLMRDGRVAELSPSRNRPSFSGRRLDGAGHTLLPGLIDAHLHFVVPDGFPRSAGQGEEANVTGRQILHSGVTSGRLHLDTLERAARLKVRSQDDCEPMPRLQVGGPGLGGRAAKDVAQFWGVTSVADARDKVERIRAAGVEWIALHDADGFATGVLQAIATAARKAGLRLMAAGTRPEEIVAALEANPDTLDYVLTADHASYPADVLASIRRHPAMVLVPTLGIDHRVAAYVARPALVENPANVLFLRPEHSAHVMATARKALAGRAAPRNLPLLPQKLSQLRSVGLPVAAGSDSGSTLHFQPDAIWWELEAWRQLTGSHHEALKAVATGARVLNAPDIGELAVGRRADFVLYRGRLDDGPFDAARVIAVGKGGVIHVRDGKWSAS